MSAKAPMRTYLKIVPSSTLPPKHDDDNNDDDDADDDDNDDEIEVDDGDDTNSMIYSKAGPKAFLRRSQAKLIF